MNQPHGHGHVREDLREVSGGGGGAFNSGDAFPLQADFNSGQAVTDTIEQVVGHFGRLDILFNNAGGMIAGNGLKRWTMILLPGF